MSESENICVCCHHPIVDETIEGDMTLKDGYAFVEYKNLAVGEDSGCRNCAIILDAIVTFVAGEDRSFMRSNSMCVYSHRDIHAFVIDIGKNIEVIHHSGMSEHCTVTLELRVRKILHATLSDSTPTSGTSKCSDRLRDILLRKRLFVQFKSGRIIACNTISIVCNEQLSHCPRESWRSQVNMYSFASNLAV